MRGRRLKRESKFWVSTFFFALEFFGCRQNLLLVRCGLKKRTQEFVVEECQEWFPVLSRGGREHSLGIANENLLGDGPNRSQLAVFCLNVLWDSSPQVSGRVSAPFKRYNKDKVFKIRNLLTWRAWKVTRRTRPFNSRKSYE